jgi:hypothetical protein
MFSNSTWFTHESRVPTKLWPMPPAMRAIWVVCSDWPEPKPHGSYVCTVGFSLIERQSSSLLTAHAVPVVILFISTNCMLNSKNVLNIANDTWNAFENQTRVIMWLRTVEIFMRPNDEVTGHWSLNWHVSFWKPWSFIWDAPVWKERSSKLVPSFTNFFPRVVRAHHGHTPILMMSGLHLNYL